MTMAMHGSARTGCHGLTGRYSFCWTVVFQSFLKLQYYSASLYIRINSTHPESMC